MIFGAVYMLWMFQRVMFGPVTHEENKKLEDLNGRELLVLAPMIVAIFAMGVFPNFFFSRLEPSIDRLVQRTSGPSETAFASAKTPETLAAIFPALAHNGSSR